MALKAVRGQERAIRMLASDAAAGRLARAYLFHGPEGVGKELAAANFARLLNCRSPEGGDACDYCGDCLLAAKGLHPDLHWLMPMGRRRVIYIGDATSPKPGTVRHLQHAVSLTPFRGRWKVGILCDAHCVEAPAGSALLKTLEDPPDRTILILVTARPDALMPTIVSRCRAVRFEAMEEGALAGILRREHHLGEDDARALSRITEGRYGEARRGIQIGRLEDARALIGHVSGGGGYWDAVAPALELIVDAVERSTAHAAGGLREKGIRISDRPSGSEEEDRAARERLDAIVVGEERRRQEEILRDLLLWCRDLIVRRRGGAGAPLLSAAPAAAVDAAAAGADEERIEGAARSIEGALAMLDWGADFHAVAESLLVRMTGGERTGRRR
ncbi:MAG: DNA polymerase III subunit [bacterium]|nr:DNA polymerase III subunit [bacterium]